MPCTVSGARSSFNQLSCRITGSLDTALFHAAWQQLIDRHPVMRTSFHWEEFDKPMQVARARHAAVGAGRLARPAGTRAAHAVASAP